MSIQFRTRISSGIEYKDLLNYGLCCQDGISLDISNHLECYAASGQFIPGNKEDPNFKCPDPEN